MLNIYNEGRELQLGQDYYAYTLKKDHKYHLHFFNLPCLQKLGRNFSGINLAARFKIGHFWFEKKQKKKT